MSTGKRWCCRVRWLRNNQSAHRAFVKDICEECGFQGEPCQLDVDHVDGDFQNNDLTNLRTICANCHRLVTLRRRDYRSRLERGLATAERPHHRT